MSKHTKGPWRKREGSLRVEREDHPGVAICYTDTFGTSGEAAGNAYLIAAAPDLLHALTMVRDADDDCARDGLPRIPSAARFVIDSAIAKAAGGKQ
jgi:hypothetical protein